MLHFNLNGGIKVYDRAGISQSQCIFNGRRDDLHPSLVSAVAQVAQSNMNQRLETEEPDPTN